MNIRRARGNKRRSKNAGIFEIISDVYINAGIDRLFTKKERELKFDSPSMKKKPVKKKGD